MPYNRQIYNIDFSKLVIWFTPESWRTKRLNVWMQAMASTWNDLYNRFMVYRMGVKYRLKITPQVCFLERALNDRYDVVERRIRIIDAPEFLPLVLFRKSENKKLVLHRKSEDIHQVLYTKSETAQFSVDFIVQIPITVAFDMDELKAFLTGLKLVTKTFKVQLV